MTSSFGQQPHVFRRQRLVPGDLTFHAKHPSAIFFFTMAIAFAAILPCATLQAKQSLFCFGLPLQSKVKPACKDFRCINELAGILAQAVQRRMGISGSRCVQDSGTKDRNFPCLCARDSAMWENDLYLLSKSVHRYITGSIHFLFVARKIGFCYGSVSTGLYISQYVSVFTKWQRKRLQFTVAENGKTCNRTCSWSKLSWQHLSEIWLARRHIPSGSSVDKSKITRRKDARCEAWHTGNDPFAFWRVLTPFAAVLSPLAQSHWLDLTPQTVVTSCSWQMPISLTPQRITTSTNHTHMRSKWLVTRMPGGSVGESTACYLTQSPSSGSPVRIWHIGSGCTYSYLTLSCTRRRQPADRDVHSDTSFSPFLPTLSLQAQGLHRLFVWNF